MLRCSAAGRASKPRRGRAALLVRPAEARWETYEHAVHAQYGGGVDASLLAGIMGHNLCLDIFGGPSDAEAAAGADVVVTDTSKLDGVALQRLIMPVMGDAAGTGFPPSIMDVYTPAGLVLLGSVGLVLAVLGALLPAGWAARTRVATALRAE